MGSEDRGICRVDDVMMKCACLTASHFSIRTMKGKAEPEGTSGQARGVPAAKVNRRRCYCAVGIIT